MNELEDILKRWANGPSTTETEKCQRAELAIRKAIAADEALNKRNIKVFAQGSYANRTNISNASDVDVNICCRDVFFANYPAGVTNDTFGFSASSYTYAQFKNEVHQALNNHFGAETVTRGNKAFDIQDNTYRVNADAVPTFEHRRYFAKSGGGYGYHEGVELRPDDGKPPEIINWPQQVYDNGVAKHGRTTRRYKKIIRILKNLRNWMQGENISAANDIASFLVECLVWNCPDHCFGKDTLTEDTKLVLAHLIINLDEDQKSSDWVEVNELKYLFRSSQPWTRLQAYNFVVACWKALEFDK